jgi:RNA polymerase sigma factor (sigma-70 family)
MEIAEIIEPDNTQAYRVKVIVRNNLLLTAIEEAGYKSVASFARELGYGPGDLQELVSLRKSPVNRNGKFSDMAKKIMEVLGAAPHDLWTTEQLTMNLHKNSMEHVVTTKFLLDTISMKSVLGGNVLQLEGDTYEDVETPEQNQIKKELKERVESSLDSLTPRQAKVLRMRFGIDGEPERTLEEVAKAFGVSNERIRQIEAKAMRLMRHPGRAEKIKEFLGKD